MALLAKLGATGYVESIFQRSIFHEAAVRITSPVDEVLRAMEAQGIVAGLSLADHYPELGQALLLCVTETRIPEDLDKYVEHMQRVLSKRRLDPPCAQKM